MAVVVFECPIDDITMYSIRELRILRLDVLKNQIEDIEKVLDTLLLQGVIEANERESYRSVILEELRLKSVELESRQESPEIVYIDELELYVDVLSGK